AKADYWYRPQRDYYPTGHLTFAIDSSQAPRRNWNEGVRQRLENCVDSITKALLATGEHLKEARLRREAEEQIQRVESRQAFANERRQREEKERVEALDRDVDRWIRSKNIRAYLAAFKACMEKWSGPIQQKSDAGRWLTWAQDYADRLDPLEPRRK
ncbi:MAG TPA: hypothetical protein VN428_19100, partial [Bryobacteraceae bacterium]|nr:hypothetical protein [Bryobacteraceae bacterium]